MRIGLVIEEFDPCRGGLEQWCAQFSRRLVDRGHQVHAITRRFAPSAADTGALPEVVQSRSRTGFAAAAEGRARALALDITHDTGSGWHCDVFQPHFGSRPANARAKLLLLPAGLRPLRQALSGMTPRHRQFARIEAQQYIDDGRLIVALSRRVAADFCRYHGTRPEQIRLVYNGVDEARFSPSRCAEHRQEIRARLGVAPDKLVLLIVAHNFRLKGVPALLRAIERMAARRMPVHLAVVGGRRLEKWQRFVDSRGIAPYVSLLGPVADTLPWYAAADVYVHPSIYDACSLVVLEALACGLPVITSRENGASELLTEGREGHVLGDPQDDAELAALVERMLEPSIRLPMGLAARRLALVHTLDGNCKAMEAVYREAIERRASWNHPTARHTSHGGGGRRPWFARARQRDSQKNV